MVNARVAPDIRLNSNIEFFIEKMYPYLVKSNLLTDLCYILITFYLSKLFLILNSFSVIFLRLPLLRTTELLPHSGILHELTVQVWSTDTHKCIVVFRHPAIFYFLSYIKTTWYLLLCVQEVVTHFI